MWTFCAETYDPFEYAIGILPNWNETCSKLNETNDIIFDQLPCEPDDSMVLSAEPKYCEPECENTTAAFGILFVTFLVAYGHEFDHDNDVPRCLESRVKRPKLHREASMTLRN